MSTSATAKPNLPLQGENLAELLATMKGSDSVELKLTVPESSQRSTVIALGMDPLEAQIRQVVFFDTPDLRLEQHGVIARARRVQGKGDDSIVKLRPVTPSELPAELRKSPEFRVEVDAQPGGYVCSGTLKRTLKRPEVWDVMTADRPIRKLFSRTQREFFAAHAPDGVGLEDLKALGPIFVLKLAFTPPELKRRLVAELWLFPDGSRVLELSTRTAVDEAFQVAAESKVFLSSRGVDLSGEQQPKTKKALEYFAKNVD